MKNGRLTPELASECSAIHIENIKNEDLVTESGKLVFLIGLVDRLKVEGHRCLIFSQSCKVLDIITKVLGARVRLDFVSREKKLAKISKHFIVLKCIYKTNYKLLTECVHAAGYTHRIRAGYT